MERCIITFLFFFVAFFFYRHQYDTYKRQIFQNGGISPRERSPRARRFFHRREPRDGNYSNRNGGNAAGSRNNRGDRRRYRKPPTAAATAASSSNKGDTNNQEQNNENAENKQKSRRRFNRNRKPKSMTDEQNKNDDKAGVLQMTASNLTTLLSELNMGTNSLNTANSTSSESLDFEKINTEDTNLCSATSSRLAASFNNK